MPIRYARPPVWFRYGVVALATLILCSCRSALPSSNPVTHESEVVPATFSAMITERNRSQAIPAVFEEEDSVAPSQTVRQATHEVKAKSLSQNIRGLAHFAESSEQKVPAPFHRGAANRPVVGPPDEYLCDGGDFGLPAGVRADWSVDGLEQEDTIAHYDTVDGRTVVAPSNRVCIYAPRFGVVRRVVDLRAYARYDRAGGFGQATSLAKIDEHQEAATSLAQLEPSLHRTHVPPSLLRERQQPGELDREQRVAEFDGSLAPYANLQVIRTGTVSNHETALVERSSQAAITWSGDQAPQITLDQRRAQAEVSDVGPAAVYHLKEPHKSRLRLIKLASKSAAQPGEEIEFTLRFDNVGNRTIGNVTIVDNLTTRLAYLPKSAVSSLEADFSTEPNQGGSLVLRWEIKEPVEPGQGGILQFRCRVR